jgi:hypothetical protein
MATYHFPPATGHSPACGLLVLGDRFKRIKDALPNFALKWTPRRATFTVSETQKVWFPKLALETPEGHLVPPPSISWRNTLSADQSELCCKYVGDDGPALPPLLRPEWAVFIKNPGDDHYVFMGTYVYVETKAIYGSDVTDPNNAPGHCYLKDTYDAWVCRRTREFLVLEDWQARDTAHAGPLSKLDEDDPGYELDD